MTLRELHKLVVDSSYKTWQVYFLILVVSVVLSLSLDISIITLLLGEVEQLAAHWTWLVILGIQGILIGFVAEVVYDQGDRYAKSLSHLFGSKDRTLVVRIGAMTIVSGIITLVVPSLLRQFTEYLITQTSGAVIALGILLVHQGSTNWNARTEWPAILGGVILAVGPSVV